MDHFLKRICILSELYLNFRLSTARLDPSMSVWWTARLTLFNYWVGAMVAVGYLESGDTPEGRGMMREDEQSPRAGGSSGRGDVLCCLVLSFLDYEGSLKSLLMINFTRLSLVPPTHGLFLSCHTQSFLASKPKIIVTETWCQSFRGFNFSLE